MKTDAELVAELLAVIEGKTRDDAAAATGLSSGTISNLRKGRTELRSPTRKLITSFLYSRGNNEDQVSTDPPPGLRSRYMALDVSRIKPWPGLNNRVHFDETALEELAASIRENGLEQPIGVHLPAGDDGWTDGLIVQGERRWRAVQKLGWETVPCLVREYTFEEALSIVLIENLQRQNLTPIEEAHGFKRWLEAEPSRTQAQLAEQIGVSQPVIANRLRLLELPAVMQEFIEAEQLPMRLARDVVMPFTKLDESAAAEFFPRLGAEIRKNLVDGAIPVDALKRAIQVAGIPISRALDVYGRCWTPGHDDETPLFEAAKLHSECGCGAPQFAWNHGSPFVRCFGTRWWDGKQKAAVAVRRAKEKDQDAAIAELVETGQREVPKVEELRQSRGWGSVISLTGPNAQGELLHPDPFTPETTTFALDRDYMNGKAYLAVVCTDKAVIERSKALARVEFNEVLQRRVDERDAADRQAADTKSFRLSSVLALVGGKVDFYHLKDAISACARTLGIKAPAKAGEEELKKLFTLFQHRASRGDFAHSRDPLEATVKSELAEKYRPGFEAIAARIPVPAEKKGKADKPKKALDAQRSLEGRFRDLDNRLENYLTAVNEMGGEQIASALAALTASAESLKAYLQETGALCITQPRAGRPGHELTFSVRDRAILAQAEEYISQATWDPESEIPPVAPIEAVIAETPRATGVAVETDGSRFEGEDAAHFIFLRTTTAVDGDFSSHLRLAKPAVLRAVRHRLQAEDPQRHRVVISRIEQQLRKSGAPLEEEVLAHV